MNSKKVKNVLLPIVIVIAFIVVSYSVSIANPIKSIANILMLGSMELACVYAIVRAGFNINRQRFMVCVLSLQFVLCTIPYMFITWLFTNFNFVVADGIHNAMYLTYEPASNAVAFLLIMIACWPEGSLNGLANYIRADYYLNRVNIRFKANIFSIKEGSR